MSSQEGLTEVVSFALCSHVLTDFFERSSENIDLLKAVSFELVLGVLCSVLLSKVNLHESVVAYLQLPD